MGRRAESSAAFAPREHSPAWSPDGKWLAFTTWSDSAYGHVWKVRADGSGLLRLTEAAGFYLNPTWSTDGGSLVLARGSGSMLRGRMASDEPWFDLVTVSAAGGPVRRIAEVEGRGVGSSRDTLCRPSWGRTDGCFTWKAETRRRPAARC